jgi:hypothetical protein
MIAVLSQIIPWEALAALFAAIMAGFGLWLGGRKSAKTDAKVKDLEAAVEGHEVRNEVENRIASEHDAASRLREKWSK